MIEKIKNEKINKFLYVLIFASFILLPIDNFPYFQFAGEIGRRLSLYPFIIAIPIIIVLSFINRKTLIKELNNTIFKIIGIFYIWTIVSIILNFSNILHNIFKGRTGIEKLVLQLLVLTFMLLLFYSVYYIVKNNNLGFNEIRRFIMISFLIVGIYCIFELLTLLNIIDFSEIIKKISYFIHNDNRGIFYERGIRGFSGEASYFGMYISFILPWIFSYIFTERKIKYILLFLYMLLITFFTKSRFAIAIIYLQVFLYFILFMTNFKTKIDKKKLISVFLVCIVVVSVSINLIYDRGGYDKYGNSASGVSIVQLIESITNPNNYSNIARIGLMRTAINMGVDNPVAGVGLGQFAFNANKYVNPNALISHEVQNWLDNNTEAWTPAFSIHTRILAEQGVIGLIIWITLWSYVLFKILKKWKSKKEDYYGLTLIVSICGVLAAGFNADTYAFAPYWILLALSICYLTNTKNKKINI